MSSPARAATPDTIVVRLYDASHVDAAALADAVRTAGPILDDAGMRVAIRLCGGTPAPDGTGDRCNDVLGPSEIVARVITAPRGDVRVGAHVFGIANLERGSTRGRLATLYWDRIASAAARVGIAAGPLLGRVLAHEVGHVLLGTQDHSAAGLMRADWTDDLLHQDSPAEWRISRREAMAMQRQVGSSSMR